MVSLPNPIVSISLDQPSVPCLSVRNLTKVYGTQSTAAVQLVSFDLNAGDILGLLGASGCGKTTLLRLIAGFEKPQEGEIWLAGRPVTTAKVHCPVEDRSIGMVFQDFALFPHLTVYENIAFGLKSTLGKNPDTLRKRVLEVLDLVHLTGFQRRYPHELSGGQQQRIALARTLAPRPKLVLLDEPLSNLDVQVRLRLRHELRQILKASQTTAIFVTHDCEEALSISDQLLVMRHGRIEQLDQPEVVYHTPTSRFVAEFVSRANLLPTQRQGEAWQTEVGTFVAQYSADTVLVPERGWLMVREEDLQVQPNPQGVVKLCDRQFLGREYRYCLQAPSGRLFHARTSTGHPPLEVGIQVSVGANPETVTIFTDADEFTQLD
jgi:iron(III) transport system ATP-binding protein